MKISLALGKPQKLSRQTAWGCLTANLAVPGTGSLAAGRRVGYWQLALTGIGFAFTTGFGLFFIGWCLTHWSQIQDPSRSFGERLKSIWGMLKWPLLGIAVFILSWLWALFTSFDIVRSAGVSDAAGVPPSLS